MKSFEQIDNGRIWLQWMRRPHAPAQTAIWFPFGGGMAHTGQALAACLPSDWAVAGIEGPGRLRTAGEPIEDIELLARYYCDKLGDQLLSGAVLIGHSVGSLVAGMVAQTLERRGTPARALVMGAARPPHTIPPDGLLGRMDDAQLRQWWRGIAVGELSSDQERELFFLQEPLIRADLNVYDSASNRTMQWHSTPAMLVLGEGDHICPVAIEAEWLRVAPKLRIERCAGGHLFVLHTPQDYAQRIVTFVDATASAGHQERAKFLGALLAPKYTAAETDAIVVIGPGRTNTATYGSAPDPTAVADAVAHAGVVLLRGFEVDNAVRFGELLSAIHLPAISYELGNSPRSHKGSHIYTASEYTGALPIWPHCELSYTLEPPAVVAFCCLKPASEGGETILVPMDIVLEALPENLVARFAEHGILYEQRMSRRPSLGRTWPATMGTDDPDQVECSLLKRGVRFEWRAGREVLVVWYRGAGIVRAGGGRPAVWFNQVDQWHRSTLPEAAQSLGDALPHDCRLGNGDVIFANDVEKIRAALDRHSRLLSLEPGDVLLLDNLRLGHGRQPFVGHRELLVGLANQQQMLLDRGGARWV